MTDGCMNPRAPCRSVSLFSCISQFVWQPWKDNIQTTRTPHEVASGLFTPFYADAPDGERVSQALNGRLLCFAPISPDSPQNRSHCVPLYHKCLQTNKIALPPYAEDR